MKPKYSYEIDVRKLMPPIGKTFYYFAKVSHIFSSVEGKDKKLSIDFGEIWGRTKEEAHSKMKKVVDEWIANQ